MISGGYHGIVDIPDDRRLGFSDRCLVFCYGIYDLLFLQDIPAG